MSRRPVLTMRGLSLATTKGTEKREEKTRLWEKRRQRNGYTKRPENKERERMILWKSCFSEMKRPLNLSSDLTPTPGSHRRWCLSVLLLVSSPRFLPLVKNYVKSFASNGNQGKEGNRTDNKRHSRHQSEQQEWPIFSPPFLALT